MNILSKTHIFQAESNGAVISSFLNNSLFFGKVKEKDKRKSFSKIYIVIACKRVHVSPILKHGITSLPTYRFN